MNKPSTRLSGFIFLLAGSFCYSTSPIAIKLGLQQVSSPFQIVVMRIILTSIILWLYFLCFQRDTLRIDTRGFLICFQVAVINCGAILGYFFPLIYIDASLMAVVSITAIIPTVLAILMIQGEPLKRLDILRFLMALFGIYLFMGSLGHINWIGIFITIGGAFFYSLYLTMIQKRLADYSSTTILHYVSANVAVLLGLIYITLGYDAPSLNVVAWGAVLWLAIIATCFARLFLFLGIKYAGSRQAALLSPFDTLLTVLFSAWLLDESLSLLQWVGTSIVLVSVALGAKTK